MGSYVELIRQDVSRHKSWVDASSWPGFVSQFTQSLRNELKLPKSLDSSDPSYTNNRVPELLHQLRASDDVSFDPPWDDMDKVKASDVQQRLHAAFDTALADCARIQAVLRAEQATGISFPKESFLAVLVRNALSNADQGLCSLDDVPVTLPRHFSGDSIPILKYLKKSFLVPLIISVRQEIPVKEDDFDLDLEHATSDDEKDDPISFHYSPPTLSEFLDECEKTVIHEDEEEDEETGALPPQFEAYFFAPPSSTALPSNCYVPVLCMADEDQLPVAMSSLLYQRRVWHIDDPLVGVECSKYDTIIKLYVGWLEDGVPSDRALPRVHLGEIGTPVTLDLSSPSVALAVTRLLCSLEPRISRIRDTVTQSVGAVVSQTSFHSSLSWRIDTDLPQQNLGSNLSRDMAIIQWAQCQQHSECEDTMAPRKKVDNISSSGSGTSTQPSQKFASAKASNTPPSSTPSKEGSLLIPEIQEPHGKAGSITTLRSPFSCSAFAATSEKDEYRVFRWMFDRQVVPQCIPFDTQFRKEYEAMTGFIWPETWRVREDLPPVDAALEPCIQELLDSVAALDTQENAINRIPVKDFPVDLRILQQSFSAIFQASRRSREKKELQENVYEASWRVDHDRLLYDFFIRLVQTSEDDAARTLLDHSVAHLEDPLARPILETTLRLPRSNFVQRKSRAQHSVLLYQLVTRPAPDLLDWVLSRGGTESQYVKEADNSAYVVSQWRAWRNMTETETEESTISMLNQLPSTGRCDALGRLLVELPNVTSDDIKNFQLVVRAAGKTSSPREAFKGKSSVKKSRIGVTFTGNEPSTRTSDSLTAPDVSAGAAITSNGERYNIPSSSLPSFSPPSAKARTPTDPINALSSNVQKLQIGTDAARLELPILAVEYKKASDNGIKGTNQLRMYLTASVKFLQAVGITNVAVYGVQTDGPFVVLPAAILRDDEFVYLFERLVERLDISTPLGAWHYATILCRLAYRHAKVLEEKFNEVKEDLVRSLREGRQVVEGWTNEQQIAELITNHMAK